MFAIELPLRPLRRRAAQRCLLAALALFLGLLSPAQASLQYDLSASPEPVVADGLDAATVTVTLFDDDNNAVAGLGSGDFSVEVSGNATCGEVSETATAGTYAFQVTNTAAETVTVTVTAARVRLEEKPRIAFRPGPPHPAGSSVAATSPHWADGIDTSVLTLQLADAQGNAISGLGPDEVSLGLGPGLHATPLHETDVPGTYRVSLTSRTAGPATVTVTVTADDAMLRQEASILFKEPGIDEAQLRDSFLDMASSFFFRRMDRMLSLEPSRYRLSQRFDHNWGLAVDGKATVTSLEGSFAASLTGLRNSLVTLADLTAPGVTVDEALERQRRRATGGGIELWAEGFFSLYEDRAADSSGNFGIVYAGADYCFGDRLLLGVMAEFDWTGQENRANGRTVSGTGWMVGPYVSARLVGTVYLDLRGAWGRSTNSAELSIGSEPEPFAGDFGTERWLLRGNLSGTWQIDSLQMTPQVSAAYLEERQERFWAGNVRGRSAVDEQKFSLGRFAVEPRIAYPIALDEVWLSPYVEPQLLWNFKRSGGPGKVPGEENLRGATEVGVRAAWGRRMSGGLSVTYDGIGQQDFEAVAFAVGLSLAF